MTRREQSSCLLFISIVLTICRDFLYQAFFAQLLRVLLELESRPAILILGAWGPWVAEGKGYDDPQTVHLPIATYLDVPYIS